MSELTSSAPARSALAVTLHDSNPLIEGARGLFIGVGGNVTLRPLDAAADVVFKNVPSGSVLPVRASHVRSTGTTATDLVALY